MPQRAVAAFDISVDNLRRGLLQWLRFGLLLQEETENEAQENEIYHPSKLIFLG